MLEAKYEAPMLTRYGKLSEFIQAGSVELARGDVTGDTIPDILFDTDGDGLGDVVVGGANGGQTPVTGEILVTGEAGYDADGDGAAGIAQGPTSIFPFPPGSTGFSSIEPASDDGWDDPQRD